MSLQSKDAPQAPPPHAHHHDSPGVGERATSLTSGGDRMVGLAVVIVTLLLLLIFVALWMRH